LILHSLTTVRLPGRQYTATSSVHHDDRLFLFDT
jgi:hypothetical protein